MPFFSGIYLSLAVFLLVSLSRYMCIASTFVVSPAPGKVCRFLKLLSIYSSIYINLYVYIYVLPVPERLCRFSRVSIYRSIFISISRLYIYIYISISLYLYISIYLCQRDCAVFLEYQVGLEPHAIGSRGAIRNGACKNNGNRLCSVCVCCVLPVFDNRSRVCG